VERLLGEHLDRRQDHSRQLWGLISFSLWAEQMERSPDSPPSPGAPTPVDIARSV
jgi:hypothetical protein